MSSRVAPAWPCTKFWTLESNHFKIPELQLLCTTDSPQLIFIQFTSNFLCMCNYCTAPQESWSDFTLISKIGVIQAIGGYAKKV